MGICVDLAVTLDLMFSYLPSWFVFYFLKALFFQGPLILEFFLAAANHVRASSFFPSLLRCVLFYPMLPFSLYAGPVVPNRRVKPLPRFAFIFFTCASVP